MCRIRSTVRVFSPTALILAASACVALMACGCLQRPLRPIWNGGQAQGPPPHGPIGDESPVPFPPPGQNRNSEFRPSPFPPQRPLPPQRRFAPPTERQNHWQPAPSLRVPNDPLLQSPNPEPLTPPTKKQPDSRPSRPRVDLGSPIPIKPEPPKIQNPEPRNPDPRNPEPQNPEPRNPDPIFPDPKPITPKSEPPKKESPSINSPFPVGIPQFSIVRKDVATGLRPMLGGLDWLERAGYKTVLHLGSPTGDVSADRRQVERRGMRFVHLRVSPTTIDKAMLEQFHKTLTESNQQPIFVYDEDGARAGALWYLYFRIYEFQNDAKAREAAERHGLRPDGDGLHRDMFSAAQRYLANLGE